MEFVIDIHTDPTGNITIEDFTVSHNPNDIYVQEDVEEVFYSYDKYKFGDCSTLNTIIKVGINEATLIDVLLNEHKKDEETGEYFPDSCTFKVLQDGYYVVDHLIIPTKDWYDSASYEYKLNYDTIYIVWDEKLYKEVGGLLVECTVREVLERNIEGTTIKKCKVDVFFTGNLLLCYINYCKRLFEGLLDKCSTSESEDIIYIRDFIWMTLNIIDYLIGFKLFMEAERILSMFRKCGGYCDSVEPRRISCGCS